MNFSPSLLRSDLLFTAGKPPIWGLFCCLMVSVLSALHLQAELS
nr:MAG TPA: hypothetical protein [Caudoviricetes sp.]